MSVKEKLIEARRLIEDPKHWTKGVFARDKDGNVCDPESDEACSFCALGAAIRVKNLGDNVVEALAQAAQLLTGKASVIDFNDTAGHWAVLRLFDFAIEREDNKEKAS